MLGPAAECVIDNIPPTVRHQMSIQEAPTGKHQCGAPRPAFNPSDWVEEDQLDECPLRLREELVARLMELPELPPMSSKPREIPVPARAPGPLPSRRPGRRTVPDFR